MRRSTLLTCRSIYTVSREVEWPSTPVSGCFFTLSFVGRLRQFAGICQNEFSQRGVTKNLTFTKNGLCLCLQLSSRLPLRRHKALVHLDATYMHEVHADEIEFRFTLHEKRPVPDGGGSQIDVYEESTWISGNPLRHQDLSPNLIRTTSHQVAPRRLLMSHTSNEPVWVPSASLFISLQFLTCGRRHWGGEFEVRPTEVFL